MGSSDSYILKNAIIKGVRGEKCGIDLQKPDVPVSGVKYIVGDLLNVPLPDSLFHNICCLSVIEHDIPISIFALEVSRLLCEYGKVYLTFDYWNPKVHSRLRICDKRWNILDRDEISKLIEECGKNGLSLIEEVDWSLAKPVIDGSFYSPDPNIGYTFGMLVFQKAKRS
jgi:SAM-dependent methyltransferase